MKNRSLILYTGIILWIIGFVSSVIFTSEGLNLEGQIFLLIATFNKWIWAFFLFVIAIPIFVEGAFRSWRTEQKRPTWISFTCMLIAVIVICVKAENTISIVASVIAIAFLAVILFLLLRRKESSVIKTVSLFIGSTFIWMVYYFSFSEGMNITIIFSIVKLMGLALICIYLIKSHGIIFAVLVHVCNNAIVAIPILISGMQHNHLEVNTDDMKVSLQRVYNEIRIDSCTNETMLIQGNLEDIISIVVQHTENTNVLCVPSVEKKKFLNYKLSVESKQSIQPRKILSILENNDMIVLDTSYEPLWILELSENYSHNIQNDNANRISLEALIKWIRLNYKVPLILNSSINPELPVIESLCGDQFSHCRTFEELIQSLNDTYNINIFRSPFEKACVIKIK